MKTKMSAVILSAVVGSTCSVSFAGPETRTNVTRVERISPVAVVHQGRVYPVRQSGGNSDAVEVVYQNGTMATGGFFSTSSTPNQHVMDQMLFTPGPGAGQAVLLTSMTVNLTVGATVTMPNQGVDLAVTVWNDYNAANTPVNTNQAGTITLQFDAPLTGWAINTIYISNPVDLTMLPGGGIQTADDDVAVEFSYLVPGGTPPTGYAPDHTVGFWDATGVGNPDVGSSNDGLYWRDANADGTIDASEGRLFGVIPPNTLPADSNFVMAFSGEVGSTPPTCYPNCDGSTVEPILNVADFICFQTKYAAADTYANCDGSTVEPVLNVADFICFQTNYAAGCT